MGENAVNNRPDVVVRYGAVTRFAFVIGQDGPEMLGRPKRLKFAASDARRLTDRIKRNDLNFLVFPRGRGKSNEDLITQLDDIASGLIPSDELLFYFAGHGMVRRGALFLMLNDTTPEQFDSTALPWSNVKDIIRRSPALSKVAILDYCQAGETIAGMCGVSNRGEFGDEVMETVQRGSAASTLIACAPDAVGRESAAIGGGFLTTLILQALGPKRRLAADGTGRVSMESMRDWMNDEIAHSESMATLRQHKPLLFTAGRPTFYLDHQPIKLAADSGRRSPLSEIAASSQPGLPVIKFLDSLWPDPASITSAKLAFQNGATDVVVEWPRSTVAIYSAFDTVTDASGSENGRPMELRAKTPEELSQLHEKYVELRDRSRAIMEMVPKRLFLTWSNTRQNRHAVDETLRNFLALANLRIFYDLLINVSCDFPSFARAHVPRELTSWEATRDALGADRRASFARLFRISGPVYDAEVLEIDGISLEGHFTAFGPKQMVVEAVERSRAGKPIINGWFFKYLVPQVELYLAVVFESLSISYSETAVLRTLHDENGSRLQQ